MHRESDITRPSPSVIRVRALQRPLRSAIAALACGSLLVMAMPLPAQAALVGTEQVLHADGAGRARIQAVLARADVRRELLASGVNAGQVQARIDALTDAEAADLAGRMDSAPAGGDVLGIAFAVFIVLLITDILGFTHVFPFTRPIR